MNLLIDVGNSTIAWGTELQGEILSIDNFKYHKDDIVSQLQESIKLSEKPSAVLLSCVASDEIINMLKQWAEEQWQLDIWQAAVTTHFKQLENSYADVQQMGVDRWLAMIAAWEKHKKALCIVDCGTALTIDIINDEGKHLGGYIAPGVEMMQQALISNTDRIKVPVSKNVTITCAKDTQSAINNGASLALISMIDRSVEIYKQQLKKEPMCIITGGMAEQIKPLLNTQFELEKELVLRGLAIMYRAKS